VSELARSGRAVMLVSHNMVTVRQFASRAILLDKGKLVKEGPVGDVIGYYTDVSTGLLVEANVASVPRFDGNLGRRAKITRVCLAHDQGVVGADSELEYVVTVRSDEDLNSVRLSQTVYTVAGTPVGTSIGGADLSLSRGHEVDLHVSLPHHGLAPGRYYLALGLGFGDARSGLVDLDVVLDTVHFEVLPEVSADGRLTTWSDSWGQIRFPRLEVVQGESAYSRQ
ncbi:MAG TPA: Wzt carbohydrate-binding domain-containing protein, partial [Acidimicrobiia bacterium]